MFSAHHVDHEWSGSIRPHSDSALSRPLSEGRVLRRHLPIPATAFDVDGLRLVEWAYARRSPVMLCPPDPLSGLPALIVAALQVSAMRAAVENPQERRRFRRIAVVTGSFHTRGVYRGLAVKGGLGTVTQLLRTTVPAATHIGGGRVQVLDNADEASGMTIFTRTIADLAALKPLDLVVVELPVPDAQSVIGLDIPTVVIATDPSDPVVLDLGRQMPTYAWGQADVARYLAETGTDSATSLANLGMGPSVEIRAVVAEDVCREAGMFWVDAGELIKLGRRSPATAELVMRAFSLFHDLLGLALPVATFETYTGAIADRLDGIARAAKLMKADELRDTYLPMIELELRDLADAVSPVPAKALAVQTLIEGHVDAGRRVLLVARTSALRAAYRAFIDDAELGPHVTVRTPGGLAEAPTADVVLLTGMAPAWCRWLYRTGLAPRLEVVAYVPQRDAGQDDAAFHEDERVASAIAYGRAHQDWLAHPAQKADCLARLCGDVVDVVDDRTWPPAPAVGVAVTALPSDPPEVPPGLWDGGSWWSRFESDGDSGIPAGWSSADREVDCVLFCFQDGRRAVVPKDAMVTRFSAATGKARAYPADGVQVGDRLVFLDRDATKDMLSKVVEVADQVPELATAAAWLGHWLECLRRAYRAAGTYDALANALRQHGCTVQGQTVRTWVVGDTIGPDDRENVRRLGLLLADGPLQSHHLDVCHAMDILRGAHVKLGQRLASIARSVGSAAATGHMDPDEIVDERSGLTAADLAESVDIVTVASIEEYGVVPVSLTGRLTEYQEVQG